jgi:hypothetical protein
VNDVFREDKFAYSEKLFQLKDAEFFGDKDGMFTQLDADRFYCITGYEKTIVAKYNKE